MAPAYWALGISITVLLVAFAAIFKLGNWYGEVNSDRKRYDQVIEDIRRELGEIRKDIKDIFRRLPPEPTTSTSPIRLSDIGEQISNDIDAKAWAEEMAQNLIGEAKGMTPYRVQELSFDHASSFEPDNALLDRMQQSSFETGIDLEGVRRVLGVELRDRLLQLNGKLESSSDN